MTLSKTPENIRAMFNKIAEKYDFMNELISLGQHKKVKEKSLKMLDIKPHSKILDLCCGTGDLGVLIKAGEPLADVTGVDFSENMLTIARNRIEGINFIQKDITELDFPDNSFDFIVMGFGLRNVVNPEKALYELYSILKPGGEFLHLDFGKKNLFGNFFDFEAPLLAKIFHNNGEAYEYLINSKKNFPSPDELIKDFETCGFKFKVRKDFVFGVISAQVMKK